MFLSPPVGEQGEEPPAPSSAPLWPAVPGTRTRQGRASAQEPRRGLHTAAREPRDKPSSVHAAAGGKRLRSRTASSQSSWQTHRRGTTGGARPCPLAIQAAKSRFIFAAVNSLETSWGAVQLGSWKEETKQQTHSRCQLGVQQNFCKDKR